MAEEITTTRRTAHEIFEKVIENASDELKRSSRALAFSGVAGGMGMGLTGLSVAVAQSVLGDGTWQQFAALMFYPLGFIAVIIGRAQLFTENTLFPVALILTERKHFLNTLRLWTVVFLANIAGAMLFAFVTMKTGALPYDVGIRLAALGIRSVAGSSEHIFWSGVIGGWIIALMAWTVTASHWTIGQVAVTWMLTVVVGMGRFAHCIATSGEILSAVFTSQVTAATYFHWLLFATLGNLLGGVTFVTLLNFGQVKLED
jgi:formate/nitrite transporter FocA (FNT family)